MLFDLVLLVCRGDEKRVHRFMHSNCAVIEDWSECVMDGEKNLQIMGVVRDWVCFDVEKEYGGEEGEVLWPHRVKNSMEKRLINAAWEWTWQAAKGQTGNDLVPGFERMDKAGHAECIPSSQLATDRERWREIIKVTAGQIVPSKALHHNIAVPVVDHLILLGGLKV